jgi:hypothetical protein
LVGSGNAMPDFPSRGRTDRDARRHVVAHGRRLRCARAPLTLPRRRGALNRQPRLGRLAAVERNQWAVGLAAVDSTRLRAGGHVKGRG